MRWLLSRVFWWALSGALIAAVVRASSSGYAIVEAGESLSAVPLDILVVDVMKLHIAAAWGASVGAVIGLLARLPRWLRILFRWLRRSEPSHDGEATPDAIIRAERARVAEAWLAERASHELDYVAIGAEDDPDAPQVENVITARRGSLTYRVMAYRHLTEDERKEVVLSALERGLIEEPEPGGSTTVVTSIGREEGA